MDGMILVAIDAGDTHFTSGRTCSSCRDRFLVVGVWW